jgi:tetratricopeptide (TPR) repeat protein
VNRHRDQSSSRYLTVVLTVLSLLNTVPWIFANHTDASFKAMESFMQDDPAPFWQKNNRDIKLSLFATRAGRHDVGIDALKKARERSPEDGRISFNLGGQYWKTGNYWEASSHLLHALSVDPLYTKAFRLVHRNYIDMGEHTKARDFYSGYLSRLSEAGQKAYQTGDPLDAVSIFEAINEMGGNTPDVYLNLGASYLASNNQQKALETWREGLAQSPGHEGLLNNLRQFEDRGSDNYGREH